MKLHRFFGKFDLGSGRITISNPELVAQWQSVLRFEPGDELMLCDGNMNEALARILSFGKKSAVVEILGTSRNDQEPKKKVTLYCGVLKGEHFEFVAEKATEAGVMEIVPVISERTVKQNIRPERLTKIIREAAEQSGRGIIPVLAEPVEFLSALRRAGGHDVNFFFDSSGEDIKKISETQFESAGIFVGPEGGWTESELENAKTNKFRIVSLGKLTLRAETAAIVAAYTIVKP